MDGIQLDPMGSLLAFFPADPMGSSWIPLYGIPWDPVIPGGGSQAARDPMGSGDPTPGLRHCWDPMSGCGIPWDPIFMHTIAHI